MKTRLVLAVLLAVIGVGVYAGSVLATETDPNGYTGKTLAKATYGEVYSHVHTLPASWDELIKTKGDSDLYVQQNTWDPSACGGCVPTTGWHTHPGPSFIIVTQGSVIAYDGDDPTCTPHVYTANTPDNAFIDPGDGHVHIIRDETGAVAQTVAVQLIPAGAARRLPASDPGNCPF